MSSLLSSYAPIGEEILEAGPLDVRAPARREAASAESVSSVSLGDVVDFTISARESFEVFMGRRYDPSELSFGVNAQVLVQDACVPSSPAFEKLAAHLTTRVGAGLPRATRLAPALASPLARYTKLLTELAALQAELADVDSEDARGGVAAGSRADPAAGGLYRVLVDGVAHAVSQTEALRGNAEAAESAPRRQSPRSHPPPPASLHSVSKELSTLAQHVAAADAAQRSISATLAQLQARVNAISTGDE